MAAVCAYQGCTQPRATFTDPRLGPPPAVADHCAWHTCRVCYTDARRSKDVETCADCARVVTATDKGQG